MTVNRKLKTAVVGLGRIAWHFHLPSVASHYGFELRAVVDPEPERLEDVKRNYGAVRCFLSTTEMFLNDSFDLVVIASPTCFHVDQVKEAFGNGADVFCDKPLATQYEECISLAEDMNSLGRKLMVYQPHRVTDITLGLKKVISSGLLGKIYMVKRADSAFNRRSDWQAFRKNGGGMLNNYATHFIDQLFYCFGGKCEEVSCFSTKILTLGDAEDVVRLTLRTNKDVIFDIDINMAAAYSMNPWYVYGDRGAAWLNVSEGCWEAKYLDSDSLPELKPQEGLCAVGRDYGFSDSYTWKTRKFLLSECQDIDFYDFCYDYFALGQKPFVPISETLEVMRVISLSCNNN